MSIASEIERIQNAKSSIKTAIENKGVTVGNGTIDTYASKINEISVGSSDNHYDTFWDSFQQNGERKHYFNGFGGQGWTDETFYPKYNIVSTSSQSMFQYALITDLVQRLKDCGVTLDTSQSTSMGYIFGNMINITTIPHISFAKAAGTQVYCFHGDSKLHTIEKLTLKKELKYTYFLTGCNSLENLTIEGEIGTNFTLVNSSKLTTESVNSVINALVDLTGATAQTLTLHATVKANLTETQIASITSKNWTLA